MIGIINFFICLSMIIIFYFVNNLATKPNNNIILETTLPYGELQNEDVIKIAKEYKKANGYASLLSLLFTFPLFIIKLSSFNIIYLLLWTFIACIINALTMQKYKDKLRKLKSNNNWFITQKHIISVDTKVSRLKNKMPISKLWFIPNFIINISTFFLSDNDIRIILALPGLITTFICLLFHHIYSKKALIVYSNNTDVNLTCNYVYKRTWSIVWVLLAYASSISCLLLACNLDLALFVTIFISISMFIIIIIAHMHVRNVQNDILTVEENILYTDDDEYWGTFFYSNPHDRNLFVEPRAGIGMTINMAHPKAKILSIILTLITIAILIPCFRLIFVSDFANIDLTQNENLITIEAATYNVSFNKDEIKDISLIDSLPKKGSKTNGAATDSYAYGHFKYEGYGKCMVFRKAEAGYPLILVKLKDQCVILSGNNTDETNDFYEKLLQ